MIKAQAQNEIFVCNLGLSPFAEVWELQRELFQSRTEGRIPNVMLLTEHPHVYTIGKSARQNHLLTSEDELEQKNVEVFNIDRGGDITYHGPGQLVAYLILDLKDFYLDVHRYLRDLEDVIIQTLSAYGILGERDPHYTGVWVAGKKIAAIGVKVSRWITMHGVAVNVNSDLSFFDGIVPCGISDRGVTSAERILSKKADMTEFANHFGQSFCKVFSVHPVSISQDELRERIGHHHTEREICLQ